MVRVVLFAITTQVSANEVPLRRVSGAIHFVVFFATDPGTMESIRSMKYYSSSFTKKIRLGQGCTKKVVPHT